MPPVTEPRIQQSVSLLPRHIRALKFLTARDGDTNVSATVRKLVESEMRELLGPEWIEKIQEEREGRAA